MTGVALHRRLVTHLWGKVYGEVAALVLSFPTSFSLLFFYYRILLLITDGAAAAASAAIHYGLPLLCKC